MLANLSKVKSGVPGPLSKELISKGGGEGVCVDSLGPTLPARDRVVEPEEAAAISMPIELVRERAKRARGEAL